MGVFRSISLAAGLVPALFFTSAAAPTVRTSHGSQVPLLAHSVQHGAISSTAADPGNAFALVATHRGAPGAGALTSDRSGGYYADLTGREHWTHFPLRVAVLRSGACSTTRAVEIEHGFTEWSNATARRVSFLVVNNPAEADVVVGCSPSATRSETHTDFDPQSGTLHHADITIGLEDQDNPGQSVAESDVQCLAAHEFGHALGIDGHSKNPHDLMYPSLENNRAVTSRDLQTLRQLYNNSI